MKNLRMKAALSSKHAFVPMWLRPWDGPELVAEWGRYLNGDGLKRSLACFLDGRMRVFLNKFYAALESDLTNGSWEGLATLKKSGWGAENAAAKVVEKKIELGNDCFKDVHKRFWYEGEEYKSSFLSEAYKKEMQLIIRNPMGAATRAVLDGVSGGACSVYRITRTIKSCVDNAKKRMSDIKVSLEDVADSTVASAFEKFVQSADCAKGSLEKEVELYNRIASFVSKSESGFIWKDNPEIPVSQCVDELDAIEDALRQFIVEVSGAAANFIRRELEFDTDVVENGQTTKETAVAYLCNERMPRNASIPLCVAFVQSIEKKVEDSRRNIARSRMDGKFTFPAYWSSLPGSVSVVNK